MIDEAIVVCDVLGDVASRTRLVGDRRRKGDRS
jgi:hypothetical protein